LNAISPAVKEKAMELMTDWALEGREQGLVEGKIVGASAMLVRAAKRKLGQISVEIEEQIRGLPLEKSEQLIEDLLDFTQLSQLEAWLKQGQV